jgi:hypothetical protein
MTDEKKTCCDCLHCKVSAKSCDDCRLCFCKETTEKETHAEEYWLENPLCDCFVDMC